jgi:beta-lactamase class D
MEHVSSLFKNGDHSKYDKRILMEAILYITKTRCQCANYQITCRHKKIMLTVSQSIKILNALIFILFAQSVFANNDMHIGQYFMNKNGCFILYDMDTKKKIVKYNPKRCAHRIAPDSTFKIPLSLMAFDQKLITKNTIFSWDGKNRWLKKWNQNQTPQTWMRYSVVWVSQLLTPQLGISKIKNYLQKFHYGNQDFSGDVGKNNGLLHAWLNSSLKISADEQLLFLINMFTHKLPVSPTAITDTFNNMYISNDSTDLSLYGTQFDVLKNNWQLYGKTGSSGSTGFRDGWFEGFVVKGKRRYVFVTNFSDTKLSTDTIGGGGVAKQITINILSNILR